MMATVMDYCPNCDEVQPLREERRCEVHHVRGESIEADADVLVCNACGKDVAEQTRDDRTLRAVYDEYRRRHGMLFPEEIKDLRERYGLSQRALARLLGWGEITIHRYENGALQDVAHDEVLKQLRRPEYVLEIIDRCGDRLTSREKSLVREAISTPGRREPLTQQIEKLIGSRYSVFGIERGFRELNIERVGVVVQWFAHHCPNLFKTKLAKLLWLADFAHFKRHRISITGLAYARGHFGPMPDKYTLLLGGLEEEGIIRLEGYAGPHEGDVIYADNPLPVTLDPEEIATLEWVARHYGDRSATELTELSHREDAWRNRENGVPIPYDQADRLQILVGL